MSYEIEKVTIEKVTNVNKTYDVNGVKLTASQIKQYGSVTEDLNDSPYAKSKGYPALLGVSKFTPSKSNNVNGFARIEIDGQTYKVGISKTGMRFD